MTVTKNTLIGDLLANDQNTARFLFEMGMLFQQTYKTEGDKH